MVGLSRVTKLMGKFKCFRTFIDMDTKVSIDTSADTKVDTRHKYRHKRGH